MIRKIGIVLSILMLMGILASAALAEGKKKDKSDIWHCGCVAENEYSPTATAHLRWKLLNVNGNAGGHGNHLAGDPETCYYWDQNAVEQPVDLYRDWSDCEPTGNTNPAVDACDGSGGRPNGNPGAGNLCED